MDNLKDILQEILNKRFPDEACRQEIYVNGDGFNFCCPVCGDSRKSSRKKRAYISFSRNTFKCFNDHVGNVGKSFMSIWEFYKTFGYDVDVQYSEIAVQRTIKRDYKLDYEIENHGFAVEDIVREYKLMEIDDVRALSAFEYLYNRKIITDERSSISAAKTIFKYNRFENAIYQLNLSKKGDVIGLQLKNMNPKYGRFKSQTWSTINEKLGFPYEQTEDFDKHSMLWNFCNLDVRSPIIVFEGIMDSYLVQNSIACLGTTNMVYNKIFYYIFDNDKAGVSKSLEFLRKGHFVFMWQSFLKDFKIRNPELVKDINDVAIYCDLKDMCYDTFEKYFTNSTLDNHKI